MKIRIPRVSVASTSSLTYDDLTFTDSGNGGLSALVPIALGVNISRLVRCDVTTNVQTARSGAVRILVRTDLPASLLTEDGTAQVDTSRSGEKMSVHTVITLPRSVARALTGTFGSGNTKLCRNQLRMLRDLHAFLTGLGSEYTGLCANVSGTAGDSVTPSVVVGAGTPFRFHDQSLDVDGLEDPARAECAYPIRTITGFTGMLGFDVRSLNSDVDSVESGPTSLVARALAGLRPIGSDSELQLPVCGTIVQGT